MYKPENLIIIDKNHSKITEKTCVVSAQADVLKTIKSYVIKAAKKQGLEKTTKLIALADGAKNCWSVLLALQPYCQSIECILDWFHIAKKFQNTQEKLGESFQKSLDSIKWEVWHGHVEKALNKLNLLLDNWTGQNVYSSLQKLYDYLKENEDYLVNYAHKRETKQTYTSQVAESHIDSLINQRHKKDRKMQWTREGAHQILQIRALDGKPRMGKS